MSELTAPNQTQTVSRNPFALLTENTLRGIKRRKALMGYLFLAPTIIGILVFTAGPVLISFGLSFFKWNVFQPPVFIGLENYQRLFTSSQIAVSFRNTFVFVILSVLLQISLALTIALAIHRRMATWARYYFRTAFFMPYLMSGAAVAIVLSYLLHTNFGAVNYYLGLLGIPPVPWLISSSVALYTIVIAATWQHLGFVLVIFMGGLGNISPEVLEAADVDGATGWRRIRYIILPMLSPTVLFAAVVGVIGGIQIFDLPYVMTRGGPGDSTRTVVLTMYEAAFKNQEIGYGSSIAFILFLVIMMVTIFQFVMSRKLVFYQ